MTQKNNILNKSGWWILAILSAVPLVLWLFEKQPLTIRSIGNILGLCGMAMFSLVIILSSRLKFFERFFKGINEMYVAHHFFGGLTLCFLLFHPLLLAYGRFLVSYRSAALFLLPNMSLAHDLGVYALAVTIITLVITFYMKLKYQVWKFTHKFMGLAFGLAFFHTFLTSGDIASNYTLRAYLFVLAMAAFVAYFYRAIFGSYLVRVFDYTVEKVQALPDKIWEIELRAKGKPMNYVPGQFAFIKLFSENLTKELHPFSFSSAPGSAVKFAIKELGDYTNKIGNLKMGDKIAIEGPFGVFNFKRHENKNQVWIAGGVGIAPFLSMLRDLTPADSDYKIDLYYSVKDENCLAFQKEIEEISQKNENLKVIFWNSKMEGFLNADSVDKNTPNIKEKDILICGPGLMMDSLKKQFVQKGLKRSQLFLEEFQLY